MRLNGKTLVLGAVAYEPKVVTIWEGFRDWFRAHDLSFDVILFTNYERQVAAHFSGLIDIARSSPLAYLQSKKVAKLQNREVQPIAMRDTDRDRTSVIVVRADSELQRLEDLRGKVLGFGAIDSPQATLIPLELLARAGLTPHQDYEMRTFDLLSGKHGEPIGAERDAARALAAGELDACCMMDCNLPIFQSDGSLPNSKILAQSQPYDHCCFTVLDRAPHDLVTRFTALLWEMSGDDPELRPLLALEGLKAWKPGRTSGYNLLGSAVDRFKAADDFLVSLGLMSEDGKV
jgi:phosphonate transport system substrate-binding protein